MDIKSPTPQRLTIKMICAKNGDRNVSTIKNPSNWRVWQPWSDHLRQTIVGRARGRGTTKPFTVCGDSVCWELMKRMRSKEGGWTDSSSMGSCPKPTLVKAQNASDTAFLSLIYRIIELTQAERAPLAKLICPLWGSQRRHRCDFILSYCYL